MESTFLIYSLTKRCGYRYCYGLWVFLKMLLCQDARIFFPPAMAIYTRRYIQRKVVGNLPVPDFFFQCFVSAFNLNRTLGPVVKYHIYLATSVSWQHGMLVIGYFGSKR